MNKNTLTLYRRHITACDKAEPTLYPNTDRDRKKDSCQCPINVHGYLAHHVGRIRHYSLETSDWIEADKTRIAMLTAGKLPGSDEGRSKTGAVSVEFAVDEFLKSKALGSGKVRDTTLETYRNFCNARLLPWCEANGVLDVAAFDQFKTTESFDQSWKNMKDPAKDLSRDSRKLVKTIFGMFLKYCIVHDWLKTNQAAKLKTPKAPKSKRYGLELHEYENILRHMETAGTSDRMKTMIELMFYTGMRISDAAKFRTGEIVRNRRETGWNAEFTAQKNGKECSVPVPNDVVRKLKALTPLHEHFWFSKATPSSKEAHLLGKNIGKIFTAAQKKFGAFSHHATCHSLRHTFSIQSLNNGVDVKTVADWLGDDMATVIKHYSHAIRSTQEMQEDVGRRSIEAMQEKMKANGTPAKVVNIKRKAG